MDAPQWRESIRRELARKNFPADYRERFIEELLDHYDDLNQELTSMDALKTETAEQRIGSPEKIANLAGTEYRKQSVLGRHPVVTFIVAPIPLLLLTFAVCLVLAWAIGSLIGLTGTGDFVWTKSTVSPLGVSILQICYYVWAISPFAVSALIICRVAGRCGQTGKWPFIACTILAVVAGLAQSQLVLPIEPGTGLLVFGFGFPSPAGHALQAAPEAIQFTTGNLLIGQLVQFAIPIAIGLYFLRKSSKQSSISQAM